MGRVGRLWRNEEIGLGWLYAVTPSLWVFPSDHRRQDKNQGWFHG